MNTTSIYCLIHYLERNGEWFPRGGTGSLVDALVLLMQEEVSALNQLSANQIIVEDGKAVGIKMADGQEKRADLLVFDADPAKVY